MIKQIIKRHKENSKFEYYSHCVISEYKGLKVKINKLRSILISLSEKRKNSQSEERKEIVKHLFTFLNQIKSNYKFYLLELYDLRKLIKDANIYYKPKTKKQIYEALNTKSKIQQDFEAIYHNFKNMAKKLPDLPMKELLTTMQHSFNLSSFELNNNKVLKAVATYPNW